MSSFALTKFEAFSRAANVEEALVLLLEHPVLLLSANWPEFSDWVTQLPPEQKAQGIRAFNALVGFADELTPDQYPLGQGPLEQIIRRCNRGEISESYAAKLASAAEVYQNLAPFYLVAISMDNQRLANSGGWAGAMQAQKILLAALDARKTTNLPAQAEMNMIAAIDYAVIVARAVWETADGQLFRDAVRRAIEVCEVDTRPWHESGEVEFSLGVLHLDPYIYQRTKLNFQIQIETWRRRPFEQVGIGLSEEELQNLLMPEPLAAFENASKYFLQSAMRRTGVNRGLSLKGHISAEAWKLISGGVMGANIATLAAEAMQLLGDDLYTGVRAEISGLLEICHEYQQVPADIPVTESSETYWIKTSQQLLDQDPNELIKQRGLYQATDLMQRVAMRMADSAPELALALWRKALPFVLQRDEATRNAAFSTGLMYILQGLAHADVERFTLSSPALGSEQCLQQAAVEKWASAKLAATLLSIAVNSQDNDLESEGIKVLELAANTDAAFTEEFLPLLEWNAGILHRGNAVNFFKAGDFGSSLRAYALAAQHFLRAQMPDNANAVMDLGVDIVARDAERLPEFIVCFGTITPELQRQVGAIAIRRIRDLARAWMPILCKTAKINPAILMLLLDMAKGSMFAKELLSGGSFSWIDSSESKKLLNRIEKQRATPGAFYEPAAGSGTLDDDDLLALYAEDKEMLEGESPAVILHNLEVSYDAMLHKELGGRSVWQREWLPITDAIQAELGSETILISYYSGIVPNGNSGLYVNIITKEAITGTIVDFSVPGMQVELNGGLADFLSLSVTSLRRKLNEDPDDGIMSNAARQALQQETAFTKGPIEKILGELCKQNKWHLCIHPHGPLHFLPFHLLSFEDGVIADQFVVTFLPNLELLNPARASANVRNLDIASFGIEFKNGIPHHLPELPGAEDEASVIAEAYGKTALTGATATESALIQALTDAKRIHIATHGLHRVSAPSFQRVYLSPDTNSDGILYAYELLRYDLHGLDLLTLSACETALGRIDIGDNFRGLTANALIAGASTVVGTLWPVENTSAKTFFGLLHQNLANGYGKREAFQLAQKGTRMKHPEFRDWGAFNYHGRW